MKLHFRRNANYKMSSCGDQGDENHRCTWRPVDCLECLQAVFAAKTVEAEQIRNRMTDLAASQHREREHFLRKHVGNPQSEITEPSS